MFSTITMSTESNNKLSGDELKIYNDGLKNKMTKSLLVLIKVFGDPMIAKQIHDTAYCSTKYDEINKRTKEDNLICDMIDNLDRSIKKQYRETEEDRKKLIEMENMKKTFIRKSNALKCINDNEIRNLAYELHAFNNQYNKLKISMGFVYPVFYDKRNTCTCDCCKDGRLDSFEECECFRCSKVYFYRREFYFFGVEATCKCGCQCPNHRWMNFEDENDEFEDIDENDIIEDSSDSSEPEYEEDEN